MKQRMFVSIRDFEKEKEDREYFLDSEDQEYNFRIGLGFTDIEFIPPPIPSDDEITNQRIAYLRKGREEVVEEFTTKLANIDDQVSKLQALPCLEPEG